MLRKVESDSSGLQQVWSHGWYAVSSIACVVAKSLSTCKVPSTATPMSVSATAMAAASPLSHGSLRESFTLVNTLRPRRQRLADGHHQAVALARVEFEGPGQRVAQ